MGALTRYWFVFETAKVPTPINLGCGVTARDLDDARDLLRTRVFGGTLPREVGVIEDVPLSSLDARHVLPAMGAADARGVWFPVLPPSDRARQVAAAVVALGVTASAFAAYRRWSGRLRQPRIDQPLAGVDA